MVRINLLDDVHYIRSQWHVLKPEKKPAEAEAAKKDDKKKAKEEAKKPGEFKIDWWQDVSNGEAKLDVRRLRQPGGAGPLAALREI